MVIFIDSLFSNKYLFLKGFLWQKVLKKLISIEENFY